MVDQEEHVTPIKGCPLNRKECTKKEKVELSLPISDLPDSDELNDR